MAGTIASTATALLLAAAERAGASRAHLMAACRLDEAVLADPDARVALDVQYRLWRLAAIGSDARDLPVTVARSYSLDTYRLLAYTCMTAADVRECFERIVRFLGLWLSGETFELVDHDAGAALLLQQPGRKRHLGHDLAAESAIAKLVLACRDITAGDWRPRRVSFLHEAPPERAALDACLDCPVRYGSDRIELVLDADALAVPLTKADPGLAGFFEQHAEAVLAELGGLDDLAGQTRRAIVETLRGGACDLAGVARRVGLSPRTFRRRLADSDLRFRELLDGTRRDLALRYLRDSTMAIGEITYLLGFSEPSAFFRAFRRWTGITPEEYRRVAAEQRR